MKTNEIEQALASHFILSNNHSIVIQNCFWNSWKEADVLAIKDKSNFVVEIEVKNSLNDYRQKFRRKQNKHFRLSVCQGAENSYNLPNYFYFAMTADLAKKVEIPEYSGLIIVSEASIKIKRKAPLLHRRPIQQKPLFKILRTFSECEALGCAKLTYKNRQLEAKK